MKNSSIEWCNHTFNPWIGCTMVSPGCANCYAAVSTPTRSLGIKWGKGQPRHRTGAANWAQPLKWHADFASTFHRNPRPRVFCASLADWLDDEVPVEWLADLLDLIRRTPNLDWLLLTKRPQNWRERVGLAAVELTKRGVPHRLHHWQAGEAPANVWIGTTVEDQTRADERIPHLLAIPARVRFLSCEPLLGSVVLPIGKVMAGFPQHITSNGHAVGAPLAIHWVIAGGESGHKARPMHPDWARSLRDQCATAGVAYFFKQWGEWLPDGQLMHAWEASRVIRSERMMLDQVRVVHVGKKAAGRDLDGVQHDGFPTTRMGGVA